MWHARAQSLSVMTIAYYGKLALKNGEAMATAYAPLAKLVFK